MTMHDKIFGMSSGAREVMRQLFFHGPTGDGDIVTKAGRGELFFIGFARRHNGWSYLTDEGMIFAMDSLSMDSAKEKWERERREAGAKS